MAAKLTYSKAFEELESILTEIQSDSIPIDDLAQKVMRSKELLTFCKEYLRKSQKEIESLKK